MIVIDYKKIYHKQIIRSAVLALKQGKIVAYPTDTSYGLAADASNIRAIEKLYKIKGRNFNKPVHIIPSTMAYAKKIVRWNSTAAKLARKFWPGALTLLLPVGAELARPRAARGRPLQKSFDKLSATTNFLGLRMPNNKIALDLAKYLKRPITATSANVSGKPDCYSAADIINQFRNKKTKPDILINAGKLPKRQPSTVLKIQNNQLTILRPGPVSEKQILKAIN